MKNNKGITLVALVVTIIVLIILAGVSISLVFGQDGIVQKAKQGRNNYIEAARLENEQLANVDAFAMDIEGMISSELETRQEMTITDACAHTYSWQITKEAKCVESGTESYICTKCHNIANTRTINPNGHSWYETSNTATCTESGTKYYACHNCDETKSETSEAFDHDYVDGICSRCGSTRKCTNCNGSKKVHCTNSTLRNSGSWGFTQNAGTANTCSNCRNYWPYTSIQKRVL